MLRDFDTVLSSSDMSLDRVLNAGLPVAMILYDKALPADLRQTMDDLAAQYAGRLLIVMLERSDATQTVSRYGIRNFPSLVTIRNGRALERVEGVRTVDLKPHIAYLLGVGLRPAPHAPAPQAGTSGQEVAARPVAVNEANFDREVIQADRPVLVDFWAPWCGPCRMVASALDAIARDKASVLKVAKVNVDENPNLAGKYRTMSIPTMIVVKGGREVDRWVGALPENVIRNRVARWI